MSLAAVFFVGFLLNLLWENLHAPLYVHYQGGAITEYVLFRAAFFDAFIISLFAAILFFVPWPRARPWLMLAVGVFFAVMLEVWALKTGRWEYTVFMPLVPFLEVGLSPTLQLGATGWLALWTIGILETGDMEK